MAELACAEARLDASPQAPGSLQVAPTVTASLTAPLMIQLAPVVSVSVASAPPELLLGSDQKICAAAAGSLQLMQSALVASQLSSQSRLG
jgi:hypothetical protein